MHYRQPEEDWDDPLEAELRRLPDLPAPDTLIPRVLALLKAQTCLPWYRQIWWAWPPVAQLLSGVLFMALLGGATWVAWHAGESGVLTSAGERVSGWLAPFRPVWTVLNSVVDALALVFRQGGSWLLSGLVAFALIMYLSCVGLGTVFYRVATKNR
jgi:hypothetical protein